jgi:septal ring factor EnvC (AmiA/AmiB activator)
MNVMSLESLKLLETKIGEFVDQHAHARKEHESLAQRLAERDEQLAEATAQLKQYEQERSEIRARLERILSRLEGVNIT